MRGNFHLDNEVFLQLSGWTRFVLPHEEVLLQAGEMLVIPPKLWHAEQWGAGAFGAPFSNIVASAADTWVYCHLATDLLGGLPNVVHDERRTQAQAHGIHHWLHDVVRLHAELAESGAMDATERALVQAQIHALMVTALAGILRALAHDESHSKEPKIILRVRMYVDNRLGDAHLSVRDLAQQLGCTPDYLSRLFFQTTGEHLMKFINRLRMERAAHLLRETELTAKEVAWACGFSTQSYFIRMFQNHFNMTPKVWRRS
ncbi:MAG: AraC family transcriptional regulator [Rhodoferax sp.]|nr:AraC family transcriptional regulator [Rhodoferax sp.]